MRNNYERVTTRRNNYEKEKSTCVWLGRAFVVDVV